MSGPWDDYKDTTQTATASGPWDDYKEPDKDGILIKNLKNTAGALTGVGDMILGIPKIGAQAALALTARAMANKGTTLNDTWKAAGDIIDESPYTPNLGKLTGEDTNPGYQAINYPFQKLGQGIDYTTKKTEEGLTPLVGPKAAGDVAGQVSMVGNILGADLGMRALHATGRGVAEALRKEPVKAPETPTPVVPEDGPWKQYTSQDELPFTNSVEDIASQRNAVGNQLDLFNDNQGAPAKHYDAQAIADGITSSNEAVANYWKERALQMADDAKSKELANQEPIHVNSDGVASDRPTMDALTRSTEGITYENVPPDGVIPRDSPKNGIEVPQGNLWETDENGIPVRQGLPTDTPDLSTPATVQGILNQDTGARNDLGNAIQEANGPKTGPDEHWGAGPVETPSRVFDNTINKARGRRYKNSQRGSIDGDFLEAVARKGSEALKALHESLFNRYADSGYKDKELHEAAWSVGKKLAEVKANEEKTANLSNNERQEIHPGYTSIPDGTRVLATHGLTYAEPTRATVVGTKEARINGLRYALPKVDFGDGHPRWLTPSNIKEVYQPRVVKNSQRGSAPMFEDFTRATGDLVKKAADAFSNLASRASSKVIGMLPEDHMSKVSGQDMIYKPEPGEKALDKALAQGPMDTHLWKNVQSGLALAAEKTGSHALRSVGEWLNWSDKRTHLDNRLGVDPVQGAIKKLPQSDFDAVSKIMMREQGVSGRLSDADLSASLSPKGVKAYKALRTALDKAWERSTATRKALGLPEVTREEAYHASMHYGDFKQSFFDKTGKLIWHVASTDKLAQMKAEAWIRKNIPNIDWEKSKPFFGPESTGVNVPRDIMSAYQNMMKFFDPMDPTTTLISDAINKYNAEHGLEAKSFDERFLNKSNIPGFEGNKPWLSQKENSRAFMNAQMKYLRDSNHWNNLQEALAQMKPILSNETLIKTQPNIMAVAAAHVSRELGITGNKLAALEASLAKVTGYVPGVPKVGMIDGKPVAAYGVSRGNVYKGVADVKTGTYLTMLGANIPYMITTPLQAVMAVAQHRAVTLKGFDHNVLKTTINSLADVSAGLAKHFGSSMTGKDLAVPMSDIGKRMLKYAEDNGIIDKTVMDETGDTRGHKILDPIKNTLGKTITLPEKVARFSTFISFAHHLMDSGKLSEMDAFKMAEDFTNHSLTSMRRADKPLIVDKLGTAGQLGYVFKSYLFNEYNQLSQFAGMARKGSVTPLLAHLGILFALGGALSLPGVNELDGAYDLWKNSVSSARPQNYKPDIGVKGAILRDLPTWASIGTVSQVTGSNLGTRFNTQIANVTNPFSDVAVPIQEGREILSLKDWVIDPTMRNALQAVHANVGSTAKGQMETRLESYKNLNRETANGRNEDNTQSYRRPSDINDSSTDYKRTPEDEARRSLGMYSDSEYKTKQIRYANNKESERIKTAYDKMMKLAITAGLDGNTDRAQLFSQKALQLDPDPAKYKTKLDQAVIDLGATPEQRDKMKAGRIMELEKVLRAQPH